MMDQTFDGGAEISISVFTSCNLLPAIARKMMPAPTNAINIKIIFFKFFLLLI